MSQTKFFSVVALLATFSSAAFAEYPEYASQMVPPEPPTEPVAIPKEFLPSAETLQKSSHPIYYQNAVRVFCYHDIRVHPTAPAGIDVMPDMFRDMLATLDRLHYNVISTRDLQNFLVDPVANPVPDNAVVITLDDFYVGNYTHAYPILKDEFGMPATFYAHTNFVGVLGTYPKATWDNMREMLAGGGGLFLFQSHTLNHPNLTTYTSAGATPNPTTLSNELVNSRARLASELSLPLSEFEQICYPFGGYNAEVITASQAAGYTFGYTTNTGLNGASQPFFEIRRDSIFINDTLTTFKNKLGFVGSDPDGPIIIDNGGTGFSSSGFTSFNPGSSNSVNQYGNTYHRATATTGSSTATATYTATIAGGKEGNYEIFAWWPGNRDSNTIGSNTGVTYNISQGLDLDENVVLNQTTATRGQWNSLGVFPINAGTVTVTLGNNVAAGDFVFADALKFEFDSEFPPTSINDWQQID